MSEFYVLRRDFRKYKSVVACIMCNQSFRHQVAWLYKHIGVGKRFHIDIEYYPFTYVVINYQIALFATKQLRHISLF